MRLVHAVLPPGIVFIVSKVNLLQAHALCGDVADDPASGLRDTNDGATAAEESRVSASSANLESWEALTARLESVLSWVMDIFNLQLRSRRTS